MNATFTKFGYPQTLIAETDHWAVCLRPAQITPGAMVLGAKGEYTSFPALPEAAFTDLREICRKIETAFRTAFGAEKFNYIMLMLVDPHVHMHVLPRYSAPVTIGDVTLEDPYWPGPCDIMGAIDMSDQTRAQLQEKIIAAYNAA